MSKVIKKEKSGISFGDNDILSVKKHGTTATVTMKGNARFYENTTLSKEQIEQYEEEKDVHITKLSTFGGMASSKVMRDDPKISRVIFESEVTPRTRFTSETSLDENRKVDYRVSLSNRTSINNEHVRSSIENIEKLLES